LKTLTTEQYNFFRLVSSLAFVNPFSEQREQADCTLLNIAMHSEGIFQRSEKIQHLLHAKFQSIDRFNISDYQGKNSEIIKYS